MKTKLTEDQKAANKLARQELAKQTKEANRINDERNQPEVKEIIISIEWRKSRTWGSNPNAKADVTFKDKTAGPWGTGFYRADGFTCSGCGYDKESTVIAEIFNKFLKSKLWQLPAEALKGGNGSGDKKNAPYGIHLYSPNRPHFGGGIGTSCYYRIAEYLGATFEHVASGKMFDVYKYTDISAVK